METCRKGHPWTPENTYIQPSGAKRCRQCRNDWTRVWKAKRRPPAQPKTHCKRGHELTAENTYIQPSRPGVRRCGVCKAAGEKRWARENKSDVKYAARKRAWRVANGDRCRVYAKISKIRFPLQVKARIAVSHAITSGRLSRPSWCSHCLLPCKPEAHHHRGYDEAHWLDVQWLCRPCHREAELAAKGETSEEG